MEIIQGRLQCRDLRGHSAQMIAPGGATHLRPETLRSWFDLFGFECTDNWEDCVAAMVGIQQTLRECVRWVDLLTCDNGPDEENWLHGGSVDHASCPHCRSLWSGIASGRQMLREYDEQNELKF